MNLSYIYVYTCICMYVYVCIYIYIYIYCTHVIVAIMIDNSWYVYHYYHLFIVYVCVYFIGLLIQISILLIIYSIVLLIFGIENAFIIAFLCALLNLIPYIGPLIAAFLMLVLSMTSNIGADFSTVILPKSIYVLIGFVIGQFIDNFFSQPFIFSNSVKSHPLEIFIIILTSGLLFGTTGLIFAVPMYTAIKVIFKEFFAQYEIVQNLTKDL